MVGKPFEPGNDENQTLNAGSAVLVAARAQAYFRNWAQIAPLS
jgi:hypothetical protein